MRRIFSPGFCLAALFLLSLPPQTALADADPANQRFLTGDWGGARSEMNDQGVDIGLNYTAEPATLISGGYDKDTTYLHNINAYLSLDLDKLIGFPGTSFLAKYSSREGDNLSEESVIPANAEDGRFVYGEYYNKSQEAFGGQSTKLVNFQLTSRIGERMELNYGRIVMNDHFLRSDLYCNFMNNAICGSPKGVFTPYALNAYPDATMGVHAKVRINPMIDLQFGIFDGGWMMQDSDGWDWELGKNGETYVAELQLYLDRGENGGSANVIKVGINHHTGEFDNFRTGETTEATTSYWLLVDWMLYREGVGSQGLAFFGSVAGNDDDEIAALPFSATLGLIYQGLIPGRDMDKLGFMVTFAEHSEFNTYTHDFISGNIRGDETIMELTYNFVLGYGIQLMPSFQFISNPNGSKHFDDATVLGLKFSVDL